MAEKGGKGFILPKTGKSALKSPGGYGFNPRKQPLAEMKGKDITGSSLENSPLQKSSKGKDDSSLKSKRGRKVQFDSEGSLDINSTKSNGKADIPSFKVDAGKAGKASAGGKSQKPKAPEPLELRAEQGDRQRDHSDVGKSNVSEASDDHLSLAVEISEDTTCVMDCEAAEIMQGIQEKMVVLSEDPSIKLPVSFDRGLAYAQRNKLYDNSQAVRQALDVGFHLTQIRPVKQHGVTDGEICMIGNFPMESVDEVFALVPSLKNFDYQKMILFQGGLRQPSFTLTAGRRCRCVCGGVFVRGVLHVSLKAMLSSSAASN
ncbi:putative nuclear inhibitor of protein phosphatase 1-like isoform X1 [Capsicum annuum]|nr:putative nuclear inhibitor of protein phosphatase 1-like isoform X1 [Capsicum annuum]